MKKVLSLIVILSLFASCVMAQSSTLPRWGAGAPTQDNTGRILTYVYKSVVLTSAQASAYQIPSAYESIYKVASLTHALTDSLSIAYSWVGDQVVFVFTADTLTAGRVVTFGNHIKSAGTLTVAASKKATACFIFDGVAWIEKSRSIMTN